MVELIDASQVEEMKDDATIIDVLSQDSYEGRHLPGAINIPFKATDSFPAKVEEKVASKDAAIIVYCSDEDCELSPTAAKELEEAGFSNVHDFEAGLAGWYKAGNEMAGEGPKSV